MSPATRQLPSSSGVTATVGRVADVLLEQSHLKGVIVGCAWDQTTQQSDAVGHPKENGALLAGWVATLVTGG